MLAPAPKDRLCFSAGESSAPQLAIPLRLVSFLIIKSAVDSSVVLLVDNHQGCRTCVNECNAYDSKTHVDYCYNGFSVDSLISAIDLAAFAL